MDSLTLRSSAEAATQKTPGMYGEESNCLASGCGLERYLSPRQKCWQEREQGIENIFEGIIMKNLLGEGNRHTRPESTDSLIKGEPKETHIKAHCN